MQNSQKFSGASPMDTTGEGLKHRQTPQLHHRLSSRYARRKTGTPQKLLDTALTLENLWFSDVFSAYRNETVGENGLIVI